MNDWGANMNNEEINLDFIDNIKIDDNIDNNTVIEESKESYDFDIDKEEEEELDFDLNELINKIDSKIEELNKEESNDRENIDDVSKEIKIESNDELSSEKTSENIDDVIETKVDESSNSFNANELINKIDAKLEELNNEESNSETSIPIFEQPIVDEEQIESDTEQELSDVIDEKNEVTDIPVEYASDKKEDVVSTNINSLFEKVNSNVKEASDIFSKNVEMKKKLDKRFEELKDLQRDIEKSKQSDYEEINKYKDTVLEELTSKKTEVEVRLNELKNMQVKFEKEKEEFERYKKQEKERLEDLARDNKVKDDSRKEELEMIEDKLRKQKDSLDEEKRQLSLDRIQYEADKNELANNMLKFNEIVGTFTDGVGNLN